MPSDTVAAQRCARLRQVDTHQRRTADPVRAGNLDDPQLKRRCLDDLPFPLLHKTIMLGTQYIIYGLVLILGLFLFFGEEYILTDRTLLFVRGQNEANVSLAAAPDSAEQGGQPRFPVQYCMYY